MDRFGQHHYLAQRRFATRLAGRENLGGTPRYFECTKELTGELRLRGFELRRVDRPRAPPNDLEEATVGLQAPEGIGAAGMIKVADTSLLGALVQPRHERRHGGQCGAAGGGRLPLQARLLEPKSLDLALEIHQLPHEDVVIIDVSVPLADRLDIGVEVVADVSRLGPVRELLDEVPELTEPDQQPG